MATITPAPRRVASGGHAAEFRARQARITATITCPASARDRHSQTLARSPWSQASTRMNCMASPQVRITSPQLAQRGRVHGQQHQAGARRRRRFGAALGGLGVEIGVHDRPPIQRFDTGKLIGHGVKTV
jgi:hypothetical protein